MNLKKLILAQISLILIFNFRSLEVKSNDNPISGCFKTGDIDYAALCIKEYFSKNIKACEQLWGTKNPNECASNFISRQGINWVTDEYYSDIFNKNKYELWEYKLAGKLIEKGIAMYHNSDHLSDNARYTWLGIINIRQKKYQKAINFLSQGIIYEPKYYINYNLIAYAKRMQGRTYEAINYHSKVIDLYPDKFLNYERRGDLKNKLGDLKGACNDWEKASTLGSEEAVKFIKSKCK